MATDIPDKALLPLCMLGMIVASTETVWLSSPLIQQYLDISTGSKMDLFKF